jgi:hypothetical protein
MNEDRVKDIIKNYLKEHLQVYTEYKRVLDGQVLEVMIVLDGETIGEDYVSLPL